MDVKNESRLTLAPVLELPVVTSLDIDTERVLDKAKEQLREVIVIGVTHEGEFYFASSKSDGGDVLWNLEQAKLKLLGAL